MRSLLYLHGFRSSPSSFKARCMQRVFEQLGESEKFICPQLPPSPSEAFALARQLVSEFSADGFAVVGSSLGGFYATAIAEATGCRAALLNPAIWPARDLAQYIGEQTAWHSDDRFFFQPAFIDELQVLTVETITRPERYCLIAATGDEVLDWREMTARYAGATQRIIEGSDHALSDFARYIDEVVSFCER
ncbi:MAG: YqiA/YcfP family alpha/beta fold hydrolase [Betaproteobacteria bacterium]